MLVTYGVIFPQLVGLVFLKYNITCDGNSATLEIPDEERVNVFNT